MSKGGVSTGPMVPVLRASSVEDAREACALLDAAMIPAMVDRDVAGGLLFPVAEQGAAVLVPLAFMAEAEHLLARQAELQLMQRARRQLMEAARPPAIPDPYRPHSAARGDLLDPAAQDPIDAPEYAPPLGGRLWAVSIAVILSLILQLSLTAWVGTEGLRASWAAQAPILPDVWRLVTAGFLHSGFSHFVANALFGVVIAAVLFGSHGWGATGLVWVLGSAVGLGVEVSLHPGSLVVGASAGNFALLGLWAFGQLQRARRLTLGRRELLRTLGVLLLLLPSALTPVSANGGRVAVAAHLAGAGLGFVCGPLFPRRLRAPNAEALSRDRRWMVSAACLTAWGLGLGLAALVFR